jgi:hypothetical protein
MLAAQARAAAALRAWAERGAGLVLAGEMDRFGTGDALEQCALLGAMVRSDAATDLLGELFGQRIAALRSAPLAPSPWRHFTNGVLHSVTLATSGHASLSLALIDGPAWTRARDPGASALVAFQPGELHSRVLQGHGRARVIRNRSDDPARARFEVRPLKLQPGASYRIDGAREALAFDTIEGALVTLRLHRRPETRQTARQYDTESGGLVHQAAGDQRDSRAEMTMALLRAMGRSDAAPTVALLAREGEPGARWQALRECLALDTKVGLGEVARVATAFGDPLRCAARALLDSLAARHPEIAAARQELLCPA